MRRTFETYRTERDFRRTECHQRQYYCPPDKKVLRNEDLVRSYELDDGKQITVRDEELEALLPEKT